MVPTVLLPPVVPFTFQMTIVLVPPEAVAENCVVETTLSDTDTGEMVTEMLVTGSVHEEEAEDVETVVDVVVQVTAVLTGA